MSITPSQAHTTSLDDDEYPGDQELSLLDLCTVESLCSPNRCSTSVALDSSNSPDLLLEHSDQYTTMLPTTMNAPAALNTSNHPVQSAIASHPLPNLSQSPANAPTTASSHRIPSQVPDIASSQLFPLETPLVLAPNSLKHKYGDRNDPTAKRTRTHDPPSPGWFPVKARMTVVHRSW